MTFSLLPKDRKQRKPARSRRSLTLTLQIDTWQFRHVCCVACLVILTCVNNAVAQERAADAPESEQSIETPADLPSIDELPRPTARELLNDPPEDWLIVKQVRVLQVDPVQPRPLTLEIIRKRVSDFALTKPQTEDLERLARWRERFEKIHDVEVTLIEDLVSTPYWIDEEQIDNLIHHETHALNEAARLRELENFTTARELLEHVRRRDSDWPGLAEATNKLMFAEATAMLRDGKREHALQILDRLFERDGEFPQLELRFGQAVRQLAIAAFEDQNPRRMRYFTSRLQRRYRKHLFLPELKRLRQQHASKLLVAANAAKADREASELVTEAARYAPELNGLRDAHARLFKRYPILHVGVQQCARASQAEVVANTSEFRFSELTNARLFEPAAVEGDLVRYQSDYISSWTPEELGRRATFHIAPNRDNLNAYQIAEAMTAAIERNDLYGDRWGSTVAAVQPFSPSRLELQLSRGPLRVNVLLGLLPIELTGKFTAHAVTVQEAGYQSSSNFRSFWSTRSQSERSRGEFAEVVEHSYTDSESFGRAIRRDEVALAVDIPPYLVSKFSGEEWFSNEVILDRATIPVTHVLQFHGDSVAGQSLPLRVALERGLNRKAILREALLHLSAGGEQVSSYVRLTANLFPTFSYANDSTAATRPYSPEAAVPLALLARRQLGANWGPLKMVCSDDPEIRAAATLAVDGWRRLGIPVDLVPSDETAASVKSESWDLAYRAVSISEPSVSLWPLLSPGRAETLDSIEHLEEPLRQRLLRIDQTRDWPTASTLLANAHRAILEQALIIPLWEVDRLSIRRRSIRGVPDDRLISPYHEISNWRVEPVYSTRVD